jgi:hypothetical protein
MNPLTQSKNATILPVLIALTLGCFALSPEARAVCQDACLTNFNTVLGDDALINNTSFSNTAIGFNALYSNTTGSVNTANGKNALYFNTTGFSNTATGVQALYLNTTGYYNTATGLAALELNTTGSYNTANGSGALVSNTTGANNTASGYDALVSNTTGNWNMASGVYALYKNTNGSNNTANGAEALFKNTTGNFNTADGYSALYTNKTGFDNTADGADALFSNRFGNYNTAIGRNALFSNNTGALNIALGYSAGYNTTGRYNIDIGNEGVADESNTIRIGAVSNQTATFIAGISATAVVGDTVVVDSNGQLGTVASAARFKKAVRPMDETSETILALKPVRFQYKSDSKETPQFGLIAEEVAKVNPDLVVRDRKGEIYSVRYEAINAMLLNEFLKEHRKVEQQRKDFEAALAQQQKQIDALTEGLQKVSAQLEASRRGQQTMVSNP